MSRLMSDILWSMTNYLKFHLGDELELGSARQYGSYWDIPGGDVKVRIRVVVRKNGIMWGNFSN